MSESVRTELLAMTAEDIRVLAELGGDDSLFHGYHPRMREVHERNAARLEQIITRHGWPGRSLVGEAGAEAAWRIAHHAISRPAFVRRCLSFLELAAARAEAPLWQPAHLMDRIRVLEGRRQVYGTQLEWGASGQLVPCPIDDPEHLEERRKRVRLEPLDEQIRKARRSAAEEHRQPPQDLEACRREYEAWLREVGWRA